MTDYADITVSFRVEAADCKEAIERVEAELGEDDDLAVDWPHVERVSAVDSDYK